MNREEKDIIISQYYDFFQALKNNHTYRRLGKVFETNLNYYYDTGTNKVFKINHDVYVVLRTLFDSDNFLNLLELDLSFECVENALCEITKSYYNEKILQAKEVEKIVGLQTNSLEKEIKDCVKQITLEVTERCNLRCKYCIYNDNY